MYFRDLEITSKEFYISYLSDFTELTPKSRILEVGCGEGGNLVPFAQLGCKVTGIDVAECRIKDAKAYFSEICNHATFVCCDFMQYPVPCNEEDKYDVILLHDVIEHVCCLSDFQHGRCLLGDINRFAEANFAPIFHSFTCCQTLYTSCC